MQKQTINRQRRKNHTLSLNQDLMYYMKILADKKSSFSTIFPNQLVEEAMIDYIKKNYDLIPEEDRILELP
jgi:hypothetical protein